MFEDNARQKTPNSIRSINDNLKANNDTSKSRYNYDVNDIVFVLCITALYEFYRICCLFNVILLFGK